MKVLVATNRTQGARSSDFCATAEGEFVMRGFECDGETVDGPCGCRRSMVGLDTHSATTTFVVVERPHLTPAVLEGLILRALGGAGWVRAQGGDVMVDLARSLRQDVERIAAPWPAGTVLERRGDEVAAR